MVNEQSIWPSFIPGLPEYLPSCTSLFPWEISLRITQLIKERIQVLGNEYVIKDGVAIHRSAKVEHHAILKGPIIVGPDCFIASHCYLRGGVMLAGNNSLGPGCEIKASLLFPFSNFAHFNFAGDSIIGNSVNFEAGAVIANHYNERKDKVITVMLHSELLSTGITRFGALVGDRCRIGANAVLSPGTMLQADEVVRRLELVEQVKKDS